MVLAVLFLVAFSAPIIWYPDVPAWLLIVFEVVEIVTWVVFAADLVVRFILSPSKKKFLKSNVIDIIAVLAPLLRPIRAIRALSTLILATRRFGGQMKFQLLFYVLAIALAIWFIAGLAITEIERSVPGTTIHNVLDGWWWSFITMATVGLGDTYPVTEEGRLIGVILVLTGIATIGTLTASIAAWFAESTRKAQVEIQSELDTTEAKLDSLRREIAELRKLVSELHAKGLGDGGSSAQGSGTQGSDTRGSGKK